MKRLKVLAAACLAALALASFAPRIISWVQSSSTVEAPQDGLRPAAGSERIVSSDPVSRSGPASAGHPASNQNPDKSAHAAAPAATKAQAPACRPWTPDYLRSLDGATIGDGITFELVSGQVASGTIRQLRHSDNDIIYVAGTITQPESGRFFFQKQTQHGVAGSFVGVVELPASRRAYRIEPTGPGGSPQLVERSLGEVLCLALPLPAENEAAADSPPLKPVDFPTVPIPGYQQGIIVLESLPGAIGVIYLDFQGGYTPTWGGITYARPNSSNAQIRDVWARVAEDYMPFNINVTTDLRVYENAPEKSRQRVIITPTTTAQPGAGGVAYVGSFNWTGDTPCWVFMTSGKNCAEACSHEAGHTLGLSHDGKDVNGVHTEYYDGQGTGDTAWAPIMGTGYSKNVTQWSKGEYANANNKEDDLLVITTKNNDVDWRQDDTGDSLATARYLDISTNYTAKAQGLIERTGDVDAFRFTTAGGYVSLRADPVSAGPNLALKLSLHDANETMLLSVDPKTTLWASFATNLLPGTYTVRVAPSGRNSPLTDGFSDYASLGYYSISGSIVNGQVTEKYTVAENAPVGTAVAVLSVDNPSRHELTFSITSGNDGGAFALDSSGALTVANPAALDYETLARQTRLPVQLELFVEITDLADGTASESNRRIVVAVANVNEAPTIQGLGLSVPERTRPGTVLGNPVASDPDFYTLLSYSIVSGNDRGLFSIDAQSGVVSVAGDLDSSSRGLHELSVVASDRDPAGALTATSIVAVTVTPNNTPFAPGFINYAAYTNLAGSSLSSLTNSSRFPYEPAFEKPMPSFQGDTDWADNYGAVMRGYLVPPASGSYTFWFASDDSGQLFLSNSTNPASMGVIAYVADGSYTSPQQWTKYPSQQSRAITLTAGQGYYIEARMREGAGGDHLEVAWQSVDNGIQREIIPGRYLAPFPMNYTPRPVGFSVSLHRDALFGARFGTVKITDANTNESHTLSVVSGNAAGLFALDPTTGALTVANAAALFTTAQTTHVLNISASDNGSPPRSASANVTITVVGTNAVTASSPQQELFYNVGSGTALTDLTTKPKYPKRPDALRAITGFKGGSDLEDNYGSVIRAYVTPTVSGSFYFYISSDDASALYYNASTNSGTPTLIASVSGYTDPLQWNKYGSQRSAAISLVPNRPFYLEARHKEGGGGDHLAVAWSGPGIAGTNVVPATAIKPVDINYPPDLAGKTVQLPITSGNGTTVMSAQGVDSPLDTLTYQISSGNEHNTFAINPATGEITVNDCTSFRDYEFSSFALGIQVQDSGYGDLYPRKSTFATINVQIQDNTPVFAWTGAADTGIWSAKANWVNGVPGERARLSFSGTTRQTNANDSIAVAGPVSIANSGFNIGGRPLRLLAGLTSAGDSTWAVNTVLNSDQGVTNLSGTLNVTGDIDNNGKLLRLHSASNLRAAGILFGQGGLTKSGPGTVVLARANSYHGPTRVEAGVLAVTDPSALSGTPEVEVLPGTTLDVSGLPDPFIVLPGVKLTGQGQVKGSMMIKGIVSPAPGTLSFDGDVALLGRAVIHLHKDGSNLTNDTLRVAGELTFGGVLSVTNTGDTLAAGDLFKIFDASRIRGGFLYIGLPPLDQPGSDLQWDTTRLAVDGALRVTRVAPSILPVSVAPNGELTVRIPSETGRNYELETADRLGTDAVWEAVSTQPGDGSVLSFTVAVDASGSNRFYRVRIY